MQRVLLAVFCTVSYGVISQTANAISTPSLISPSQSNREELTPAHQAIKEGTATKKDKFSCVLNLLKTALSDELENSPCQVTDEITQDSIMSSLNSILEEEQMRKVDEDIIDRDGVKNETETNTDRSMYKKIIKKIASSFSKPQNLTNENNVEIPTMVPIFKPRYEPRSELNQNLTNFNPAHKFRQIPKSKAISFVPEKIIQTNINPIPSPARFQIPCQRAADVLDMTNIAIPKKAARENVNVKPNFNPIVEAPKVNNVLNKVPGPVTLSVDCADSDDTVAMLFKPKNISLMQLYGNLLKKITITVLVPYHMSTLGVK